MSDLFLLPEDWAAAEESATKNPPHPDKRAEVLEALALLNAKVGTDQFHLLRSLREPRHEIEHLFLQEMTGRLSRAEFKSKVRVIELQPLSLGAADAAYIEQDLRLDWLSRFFAAVTSRANCGTMGRAITVSAAERDRYLLEARRSLSLSSAQTMSTIRFAEETRRLANMGKVTVGHMVHACAFSVVNQVITDAQDAWARACAKSGAQNQDDDFDYAVSPENFYVPYLQVLPKISLIGALLREEAAAVRIAFNQSSPAAPIQVINNIQTPPATVTVNNIAVPATKDLKRSQRGDQPQAKAPLDRELVFSNWAIGLEDGKKWWLFHWEQHGWEHRRQVKIPGGRRHWLLAEIAERGGTLDRDKLIVTLRAGDEYRGQTNSQIAEKLKYAMSDIREQIRAAISETLKREVPSYNDPIPLDQGVWDAAINVGFAYLDDHKQLAFRLHH